MHEYGTNKEEQHTASPQNALPQHDSIAFSTSFRVQLQQCAHLFRTTPGIGIYLLGGFLVWLGGHVFLAPIVGTSLWGQLASLFLRAIGLQLVVLLYFQRTGHLATARADLQRLRQVLQQQPDTASYTPKQRWLLCLAHAICHLAPHSARAPSEAESTLLHTQEDEQHTERKKAQDLRRDEDVHIRTHGQSLSQTSASHSATQTTAQTYEHSRGKEYDEG